MLAVEKKPTEDDPLFRSKVYFGFSRRSLKYLTNISIILIIMM